MPRLPAAFLLLVLLLAVPVAAAFPASDAAVDVAFAARESPVVLASGQLDVGGSVRDGVFVSGLNGTRLGPLVELTVAESGGAAGPSASTFRDVVLVLHRGSLVWALPEGEALLLDASLDYGLVVALPQAPFGGSESRRAPPGLMLMGPELGAALSWSGAEADLVPLDATVSIQDRTGKALSGWDRRRVNEGMGAASDAGEGMAFRVSGAFAGSLVAEALAGGVGDDARMALSVAASERERLPETLSIFSRVGDQLRGDDGSSGSGVGGGSAAALESLGAFSGILNGALLVLTPPAEDGASAPAAPREATMDGEPVEFGSFALLRSRDLGVAWLGDEMRIQGTASVAVTQDGFAVRPPARVGVVPLASVVLWLVAVGAVVMFVVRRPPKAKASLLLRLASAGVNLVVLLVVFWLWDGAFAETFGTSFLTRAGEVGFSAETIGQLGTLLGLQMLPWSVAALFFALPVRIALGVALRYVGKGKSFQGIATAGGLVALGVLGPFYALWLLDVLIGGLVAGAPMFAPGA